MANQRRHARGGRSLKRKVSTRSPRKTLAVWCEGERTEPEYLEALRNLPAVRDVAAVEIRLESRGQGSVPLTLVRKAAEQRKRARYEIDEIDEYWCIFDVEAPRPHPNLAQAMALASGNKINVAVSNPNFEFWLILHHRAHTAYLTSDDACRLRRQLDSQRGKGLEPVTYIPMCKTAAWRAEQLDAVHRGNGTSFPNDNPGSGMHQFLRSIGL